MHEGKGSTELIERIFRIIAEASKAFRCIYYTTNIDLLQIRAQL